MSPQELLSNRFEVIAEYPKCVFEIGEILQRIEKATNDIYHTDKNAYVGGIDLEELEKYPHLFKKLKWWEYRNDDEMPEFITSAVTNSCFKIEKWNMKTLDGFINFEKRECASLQAWTYNYGYFPCTEEEYNKFLQSSNNENI